MSEQRLTHLDDAGAARMVDVSAKAETERAATARARVRMTTATAQAVAAGNGPKGDVVAVARLAAIQAAKRTDELIPLAHSLPLSSADADVAVDAEAGIVTVTCSATVVGRTGVEMEAMVGASIGALTVYDMVKGIERGVVVEQVELLEKRGGRSGLWRREEEHDVVIDIGEAYDRIGAHARPLPGETVPLADAAGRVLSAEVLGAVDLPGFDRSSMDGWAVRSEDFASPPVSLPVRGDVAAGSAGDVPLEAGTAVVISTGAPMPPGSDAVLPLEDGEQTDGVLTSFEPVRPKAFVRFRGEDVRAGELLVPAGARLTPARLSVVASGGVAEVEVHRRPRVSVVATGSELVPLGEPLPPGAIYNSNGPTLTAFALASGAVVLPPRSVADDPGSTRDVLGAALDEADVVLVSGGVSVGGHDLVKGTLADLGVEELFWRVRIKPGKPIFCGRRGDTWVFGLPGQPGLHRRRLHDLRGAAAAPDAGRALRAPATSQLVLAADAPNPGERTTYATARFADGGVALTGKQGSHMTKALADADGFAILPWDRDVVPAGETVEFLPLPA